MKENSKYQICPNNQLGVTADVLKKIYNIPGKTIDNGISLFKTRKSTNWAFIYIDGVRYIIIDRIPKQTRSNYKIPNQSSLLIRQIEISNDNKGPDIEVENALTTELKDVCDEEWPLYISNYAKIRERQRTVYAIAEAALQFVAQKLNIGIQLKTLYNVIKSNCKMYCSKGNELKLLINPGATVERFEKKIEKGLKIGFNKILVHGNKGKESKKKISQAARELVISMLTDETALKLTKIYKKIKEETNFKVSYRTIRRIHVKEKELAIAATKGIENYRNNRAPYFKSLKPRHIGDYAEADGTRHQFVCKDRNNNIIFERSYSIVDGHSGLTVGCIGESENDELAISTFKLFVKRHKFLPREIRYDGASAHKSERFKEFKNKCKALGVVLRPSQSSTGLASVERHHLTFLTRICNGKQFFVGEGIKSKHDRDRPSPKQIAIYRNKENLITQEELHTFYYEFQQEYNNDIIEGSKKDGESSAQMRWNRSTPKNAVKVSPIDFIKIFGDVKNPTVQKGVITFSHQIGDNRPQDYSYSIYKEEILLKVNFKKVIVRYDTSDMSVAYLFSTDDEFLSTIEPTPNGEVTTFNQTEKGKENLKKHFVEKKKLVNGIEEKLDYYRKIREGHSKSKIPIEVLSCRDNKDTMDEANLKYFQETCNNVAQLTEAKRKASKNRKNYTEPTVRTSLPLSMKNDARRNATNYLSDN